MKRTIIALTTLIGVVAVVAWAFMPRPFSVEAVEVRSGRFEQTIDDDGKTRVRERYIVSAPIAGRMERVELRTHHPDGHVAITAIATLAGSLEPL